MPNLNPKRFSQPEALSKIRRESLLKWLAPATEYFAARGIIVPKGASTNALNFEALAAAFVNPEPDMPEYLVESLEIINEMADERGMDAILEAATQRGVTLALPDFCTPADVALEAWLQARELLEEVHLEHQLTRPRAFVHFACAEDNPPVIQMPSAEQLKAIEARLDAWYSSKQRGRGCRVRAFPNGKECKFLVRHGDPCKREAAIKDGESTSVFFRPEKYDVVTYDWQRGELRIHCSGTKELHELRKAFGAHLFSQEEFFPGTAKYTLAPLLTGRDCLACQDIAGIERVALIDVEILHAEEPFHKIKYTSLDVFALVETGKFAWPEAAQIKRATFEIVFSGSRKSRRVRIVTPNKALYGRDEDARLIERWMRARGFVAGEQWQTANGECRKMMQPILDLGA